MASTLAEQAQCHDILGASGLFPRVLAENRRKSAPSLTVGVGKSTPAVP